MAKGERRGRAKLEKYWADVRARAATLAAAALGLLLWSTAVHSGLGKELLQAGGVALLTTGVVDLLVGGRLRRELSTEILDAVSDESGRVLAAVGIAAGLESAGIVQVDRTHPDWDALMQGASAILLLPLLRPTQLDRDWSAALEAAAVRPVHIEIHIPSDQSPNLSALAERIGESSPEALAATLSRLPTLLVAQWEAVTPRPGGQLRICTFDGVPGYAIAKADNKCAVVLPTVAGPRPAERPRSFVFDTSRDETLAAWIVAQLASLETGEFDLKAAT
jgi:hypothetical protein